MSTDALLGWLLEGTLATSAALLLILALRLPLRRLFGAGVAYASWALVPLSLLAVSLPAPVQQVVIQTMRLAPVDQQAAVAAPAPALAVASWWTLHGPLLLAVMWGFGALIAVFVFWRQQRRYVASLGRVRRDAAGLMRTEVVAGCPAVVGVWQPRIVLPADFEARYPAHEGELVLAHERVHLARQDVRLNLLAVALRCAHWFNPLLHAATRAYRQDQELACDAAVLARHPNSRRTYADAMLKTQLAVLGLPVGCHWQSSQSLRERILMLKKPLPRRGQMRLGAIAIVALMLGFGYTAWAMQPERNARAPAQVGTMLEGNVLYADIATQSGPGSIFVMDGGMGNGPQGVSRAFSSRSGTLKVGLGKGMDDPGALLLIANMAGTRSTPELQWRLERDGLRVDGGSARMPAGQSVTLDIDGAKYRAKTSARVKIMHATDGVLMGEFDEPRQLLRGADGIYIDEHGGGVWGSQYKVAGTAQVLIQISERGDVVGTTVESSNPPGVLTEDDARTFFKNTKYSPQIENGIAVPARIRAKVTFSPPQPQTGKTVDAGADAKPGITVRDAVERIATASGLRIANPEILPTDRKVRFVYNAVPAEVAFELLAQESGLKAVIAGGQVRFEPGTSISATPPPAPRTSPDAAVASAGPAAKIDLRMKLQIDGAESTPRVIVRSGKEFQIRVGTEPGGDMSKATTIDGVATLLADGRIEITTEIRRGEKLLASPSVQVADGHSGSVEIKNDDGSATIFKLEFDASAKPERYNDLPSSPKLG